MSFSTTSPQPNEPENEFDVWKRLYWKLVIPMVVVKVEYEFKVFENFGIFFCSRFYHVYPLQLVCIMISFFDFTQKQFKCFEPINVFLCQRSLFRTFKLYDIAVLFLQSFPLVVGWKKPGQSFRFVCTLPWKFFLTSLQY